MSATASHTLDTSIKVENRLQTGDAALLDDIEGLKADPRFHRPLLSRTLKNGLVVPTLTDFSQIGPMDFSARGIQMRRAAGHDAITTRLRENRRGLERLERTTRGAVEAPKLAGAAA